MVHSKRKGEGWLDTPEKRQKVINSLQEQTLITEKYMAEAERRLLIKNFGNKGRTMELKTKRSEFTSVPTGPEEEEAPKFCEGEECSEGTPALEAPPDDSPPEPPAEEPPAEEAPPAEE
jgi:hypothetical protein